MSQPIPFRQRLATNTLASLATNVWTIVLTIGSLPIVLHGLGAEAFGVWVFLQTFSATNGWLSVPSTGLSTSAARAVAAATSTGEDTALQRSIGATFSVFAAFGALFGAAAALLAPAVLDAALDLDGFDSDALRLTALAFGAQITVEYLCLAITSSLEGLQQVAKARGIDALRKTAVAAASAAAATSVGSLQAVAVASAAASAVVTFIAGVAMIRSRSLVAGRPQRPELRALARYAGTVSALSGAGVLHRTMDRTIVGIAFGPQAVAVVEVATQIQMGSTALLTASTYPVLSTAPWLAAREDIPALRSLLDRATRYSVLLTIPLVALIVVFAGPFVRLWVGDGFTEAIGLTQVAVLYVALTAPLAAGSNLLQGIGKAGAVLRAAILSVLVNLVASILLVNVVGTVGVFLGSMLGALALTPLLVASIDEHTGARSLRLGLDAIGRAAPPAAVAIGVGWLAVAVMPSDLGAMTVGGAAATIATIGVAGAWSLHASERHEIVRSLTGPK